MGEGFAHEKFEIYPKSHNSNIVILFYNNIIADGTKIIQPSNERRVQIEEGENTTLTCVGEGYPPPLVQWRKHNGSLSDRASTTNMSISTNEGNVTRIIVDLILIKVYREDTGAYECSARNLLNDVARNIFLIVQCMESSNYYDNIVLLL